MSMMQSDNPGISGRPLMIVGMTGPEPEAVLETLGLSLQAAGVRIFDTPATLMATLEGEKGEDVQILALATSCSAYLAGSIAAGLDPTLASETWYKVSNNFLALCRTLRAKILVLDTHCACSMPWAVREAVKDRFGRELAGNDAAFNGSTIPPIINLLAQDITRRDLKLRRAQSELEAMTRPLDGITTQPAPDPIKILKGIRVTQEELQLAKASASESAQASANLQQRLNAAEVRMAQTIETARAELREVSLDLENARQLHATKEDKHIAKINQLQTKLQTILTAEHKSAALRQDLEKALQTTRAEVSELRNSTSWKITGPMRRIRRMMSLRKYRAK